MDNNNFKKARLKCGFSQKKLAKILGCSVSTICRWEKNKVEPDYISLAKIADLFNVSIDYLVTPSTLECEVNELKCNQCKKEEIIEAIEILKFIHKRYLKTLNYFLWSYTQKNKKNQKDSSHQMN